MGSKFIQGVHLGIAFAAAGFYLFLCHHTSQRVGLKGKGGRRHLGNGGNSFALTGKWFLHLSSGMGGGTVDERVVW